MKPDRNSAEFQRNVRELISPSILLNVSYMVDALRPLADDINAPITLDEFIALDASLDWESAAHDSDDLEYDQDKEDCWILTNDEDGQWGCDDIMTGFDNAEEACEALGIEPYEHETLEFWAIDPWLARHLRNNGENVQELDALGMTVWCRTTSGQSIFVDHVMEEISIQVGKN